MNSNWQTKKIQDLITPSGLFADGDWVESKDQDPKGSVRLIQLADIGDGKFLDRSRKYLTKTKALELGCTFLTSGDILYSRLGEPLGKATLFNKLSGDNVTVVDVAIIRPNNSEISNKFLMYLFNSPEFRRSVDKLKSGTTRKRISRKNLAKIEFKVPKKEEQLTLIETLDSLFSKIDAGEEGLRQVEKQLEVYRQAVLEKAFAHSEAMITIEDASANIVDCLHSTPKFEREGRYCVDTTCIKQGKILFEKIRFVGEETFNERIKRLRPKEGDILFSREGTVGTSVVVPGNVDLCLGQRMMMFRPKSNIDARYMMFALQSNSFKKQYAPLIGGTTSPHLNIRDIKSLSFPNQPLQRQREVVEFIEKEFSVMDETLLLITNVLAYSQNLRQSILKKAFNGELT